MTAVRLRPAFLAALALAVALVVVAPPTQPAFAAAAPGAATAPAYCYPDGPDRCSLFLYRQANFGGTVEEFAHQDDNTCVQLRSPLTAGLGSLENRLETVVNRGDDPDAPAAADTPGQAVLLFAGAYCTGASYRFSVGSYSRDLAGLGFARAVSVKFVVDPCEVYRDASGKQNNLNVCVYADAMAAGRVQVLPSQPVNTCLALEPSLQGQVTSVRNNLYDTGQSPKLDQDVLLFAGEDCTGDAFRVDALSDRSDLSRLGFDNRARSIKFVVDPCGHTQGLCLWANDHYDGPAQVITAPQMGACVNLDAALAGQVSSYRNNLFGPVRLDVALFAGDNCTGGASKRLDAGTSESRMSEIAFDNMARSVRFLADTCQFGTSLCLWADELYEGPAQIITAPREGACVNLDAALAGQVTSYRNTVSSPERLDVALFAGDNCTGASKRLDAGSAKSNLGELAFDNKARSVRFLTDSCRWGNSLCLYTDAGFEGEAQVIRLPAANSCINVRPGISGQVSSLRNWLTGTGSYYDVDVFAGAGCTGATFTLWSGNDRYDLAATPFENSVKSVRFLPR